MFSIAGHSGRAMEKAGSGCFALGGAPALATVAILAAATTATIPRRFATSATVTCAITRTTRVRFGLRLQRQIVLRLETFHLLPWKLLLQQLLNARQHLAFIGTDQR